MAVISEVVAVLLEDLPLPSIKQNGEKQQEGQGETT
jgi:hypothetical protein